jgi:hypothetical protein
MKTLKLINHETYYYSICFAGILISCNSSDKQKTATQESSAMESETKVHQMINKQLKNIDTDEALIATALMVPKKADPNVKLLDNIRQVNCTLKEGDNEFIILADNPNQADLVPHVIHKDLEPFMEREEPKGRRKDRTRSLAIRRRDEIRST